MRRSRLRLGAGLASEAAVRAQRVGAGQLFKSEPKHPCRFGVGSGLGDIDDDGRVSTPASPTRSKPMTTTSKRNTGHFTPKRVFLLPLGPPSVGGEAEMGLAGRGVPLGLRRHL